MKKLIQTILKFIRKCILNPTRLSLFFLIGSVALSPSFIVGRIAHETEAGGVLRALEVRVEDFVLLLIVILGILYFLTKRSPRIPKPPLLVPIAAWLFFGSISYMTNVMLGNVPLLRSLLFLIKEIEFFVLYFATFYLIRSAKEAVFALKTWIFFTALNAIWVIIHFFTPNSRYYYYGPTLLSEPGNPFASGTTFLTIALFFINLLIYYYLPKQSSYIKKIFMALLLLAPIIGIFGSGSQTAFFAFVFSALLLGILLIIKVRQKKYIVYVISIVLVVITIVMSIIFTNPAGIIRQMAVLDKVENEFSLSVQGSRANIWMYHLLPPLGSALATIIGLGKAISGESHNQFIRNFAETGIVGSLLFIILIYSLIKIGGYLFLRSADPLQVALSAGLISATFAMILISIPSESFIYSVKLSETFWSFVGITMAVSHLELQNIENSLWKKKNA